MRKSRNRTHSGKFCYEYPRPALAVDLVVSRSVGGSSELLLIQRRGEPFRGLWALPGGFVEMNETLEQAAARELHEETGVSIRLPKLIGVFSTVDRDPRERVVSVAYAAIVPSRVMIQPGDDAENAAWYSLRRLPPLAFDHRLIVRQARKLGFLQAARP